MNNKLLSSVYIAIFVGLIIIPLSCIYDTRLMPYFIGATCASGILAYLHFSQKQKDTSSNLEEIRSTNEILKAAIDGVASRITTLEQEIKSNRDFKEKAVESFKAMAISRQNALAEMTKAIESANIANVDTIQTLIGNCESQYQSIIKDLDAINSKIPEIPNTINSVSSQFGTRFENITKDIQEKFESILSSSDNNARALINTVNTTLSKVDNTLDVSIESSKTLSSCISEFICKHDDILSAIENTNNKAIETQSKIETTIDNMVANNDRIIKDITDSFSSSSYSLVRSIKSSNENLLDELKEKQSDLCDMNQTVMDSLDDFSKLIKENITTLSNLISKQDDKLSTISKYMPEAIELSKSEENLMDNLVKICRQNTK
ncbi:MAG: hypothetical protein K2H88_06915 [Duncaniella sp.]|nr:hypothetical protein [Duncaniella sp.]